MKSFKLKNSISILGVIILLFSCFLSSAQSTSFFKTYGKGSVNEGANSFVEAFNGGYMILGRNYKAGGYDQDLFLIRTDKDGKEIWTKSFDVHGDDISIEIVKGNNDKYFLLSNSKPLDDIFKDITISCIDTSGNVIWQKVIGGYFAEEVYNGYPTSNDGIVLIGIKGANDTTVNSLALWELDSAGDIVWEKRYPEKGSPRGFTSCKLSNGNYAAVVPQDRKDWFYLLDSLGNILNNYELNTNTISTNGTFELIEGPDKKIYFFTPTLNSNSEQLMLKISQGGVVETTKMVNLSNGSFGNNTFFKQVKITSDSSFTLMLWNFGSQHGFFEVDTTGQVIHEIYDGYMGTEYIFPTDFIAYPSSIKFSGGSTKKGSADAVLGTIDMNGVRTSENFYGIIDSAATYSCFDHLQAIDKGFLLSGTSEEGEVGKRIYLVKTDALGQEQWATKVDTFRDWDIRLSSVNSHQGGYKILGKIGGTFNVTPFQILTVDATGNLLSSNSIPAISWLYYEMVSTNDNNYVISSTSASKFGQVFKINGSDSVLWYKTYRLQSLNATEVRLHSISATTDGGFIAGGMARIGSNFELVLLRLDKDGDVIWEKSFNKDGGRASRTASWSVTQTQDGGFAITGTNINAQNTVDRNYLVKTDSSGNAIWEKTFGDSTESRSAFYSITEAIDGGLVSVGRIDEPIPFYGSLNTTMSLAIQKVDNQGSEVWLKKHKLLFSNFVDKVSTTPDGGFAISGTHTFAGSTQFFLLKLNKDGDLTDIEFPSESNFELMVFPNPGREFCRIKFKSIQKGICQISMINLQGEYIFSRQVEKQSEDFNFEIPTISLSNGIYIITLRLGDEVITKSWVKK